MLDALRLSLNASAVTGFILYISVALLLFWLFQFIYTRITPHKEFELIRAGNTSAAVALGGAIVGFAIPDEFVVGYGIDYAQRYRHLPYIGKVTLLDE